MKLLRSGRAYRRISWEGGFGRDGVRGTAGARVAGVGRAPGRGVRPGGGLGEGARGEKLIDWLGVAEEQFRDPELFAILPMDFYYPGKGTGGDLPPRKGFAERWHPPLLALMPDIRLTLLIGRYAQIHYLSSARYDTLTDTVRNFRRFIPERFPLGHPSPCNVRWQAKNRW